MSNKISDLMSGLVPGDVICFSATVGSGKKIPLQAVVLRRGEDKKGIYLSVPLQDGFSSKPSRYNPFFFWEESCVLVDRIGSIYTEISVEKGIGRDLAAEYEMVPRLKSGTTGISRDEFFTSMESSRGRIARGLTNNGEAGTPDTQLALMLEALGVDVSQEQFAGLFLFLTESVNRAVDTTLFLRRLAEIQDVHSFGCAEYREGCGNTDKPVH